MGCWIMHVNPAAPHSCRAPQYIGAVLACLVSMGRAQTGGWSSTTTHASCSHAAIGDGMVANNEQAVIAHVEQQHATAGGAVTVPGHVTYQIILTLAGTAENVYAIYGDDRPLVFPPAFQIDPPFGSNLGIVAPDFWEICPSHQCKFDSWLTLQAPHDTSTSQQLGLSSIGVEFADVCMEADSTARHTAAYPNEAACTAQGYEWTYGWSDSHGISAQNGAVFLMDPINGPGIASGGSALVAQLTVPNDGQDRVVKLNAQGRSVGHTENEFSVADWEENCIEIHVGGPRNGDTTHSLTPPPPQTTPSPAPTMTSGCAQPIISSVPGAGRIDPVQASYAIGTSVNVICNPGFQVQPPSSNTGVAVMQCMGSGQFSPQTLCVPSVGPPPPPTQFTNCVSLQTNALVQYSIHQAMKIATLSCSQGGYTVQNGLRSLSCQMDGHSTWGGSPGMCVQGSASAQECRLRTPQHGRLDPVMPEYGYSSGSSVQVHCDSGFVAQPAGTAVLSCSDGSMSPPTVTCVKATCARSLIDSNTDNVLLVPASLTYNANDVVTATCVEGYSIAVHPSVHCLATGQWSATPVCVARPPPPPPPSTLSPPPKQPPPPPPPPAATIIAQPSDPGTSGHFFGYCVAVAIFLGAGFFLASKFRTKQMKQKLGPAGEDSIYGDDSAL